MNKTIILSLTAFAVGVVCVILSRIVSADEVFLRILFGVGLALAVLGFSNAVSAFISSRVGTTQAKKIEETDERNILIRDRAGWMTAKIMLYAISVCALVSAFANFPLYVTLMLAGLILLQGILIAGLMTYYDKRL